MNSVPSPSQLAPRPWTCGKPPGSVVSNPDAWRPMIRDAQGNVVATIKAGPNAHATALIIVQAVNAIPTLREEAP